MFVLYYKYIWLCVKCFLTKGNKGVIGKMVEKEFSSEKSLFSADLTNDLLFREPIGYSALNDGKLFWQEHKVSNSYDELMAKKAKEEEERKKFLEEEAKRKALFEEEAKKKAMEKAEETKKTHLTKEAAMLEKEADSVSKLNENIQKQLAAKREQAAAFRKARLEQIQAERKAEATKKEQQAREELNVKKEAEEEKKPEKIDNRITSDRINETVNGVCRKPGLDHMEINYDRYASDSNVGAEDVARAFKNVMGPVINTASDNNDQYTEDYEEQYEEDDNTQYEEDYNTQYEEDYNTQYEEEQYGEDYNAQYEEEQYREDYNAQYEEQQYSEDYNAQYEEQQYNDNYDNQYEEQYEDNTDNYEEQLEKQLQEQLLDDDYSNYMQLRDIVSDRVNYVMNEPETNHQDNSLSLSFDGSIINNDSDYNQNMYNDMSYDNIGNDNMSYDNNGFDNYGFDNHNDTMLSDILNDNNDQTRYQPQKTGKEGMNGNMFALIVILLGLVVLIGCTVANYNTIIEWIASIG